MSGRWWLRSPGCNDQEACRVCNDGEAGPSPRCSVPVESRVAFKMKDIRALEKMGIVPASYSNGSWIGFDGNGLSFSRRETGVVSKVELWTSSY